MGEAVFERCIFENIWVSDGPTVYGALFVECRCLGLVKGVNFGFSDGGIYSEKLIKENMERARVATYCLDISQGECTSLGFDSALLAEKVRFRERQCLILSADNLTEIARALFGSTNDKDLQLLLVCALRVPCSRALTLVEQHAVPKLDEFIGVMEHAGISVRTSPLC
jgi:hypothetical protein